MGVATRYNPDSKSVSEARCSGEAAAERRRASGDTGDTERRIREGRRRGEVSVRERAWRRSSDAMGGATVVFQSHMETESTAKQIVVYINFST